jgi:hypothetical protein
MVALIALAALATDVGHVWAARTQLQAATDSSALAGAGHMFDHHNAALTLADASAAAQSYGAQNQADHKSVGIAAGDIVFGDWDLATETFTPVSGTPSDPSGVTAIQVMGRLDGTQNGPVPTVLARVIGRNSFDVSTTAIGYLGFALTFPPGTVDFPITIDCCDLGVTSDCCMAPGAPCGVTTCPGIVENKPNPCFLEDGVTEVSCLEFHSTPEQNACWTEFDTHSPAINTPGMIDIIRDGNSEEVGLEPIYVDNGTKTPVVDIIAQKFYGTGEYNTEEPASDLNGDGIPDWVVGLPVIQCQDPGAKCASGTPQYIVGSVCFAINEVLVVPEKIIKGEFVCPGDPRHDPEKCGHGSGPGGGDFGVRAQRPVLVD